MKGCNEGVTKLYGGILRERYGKDLIGARK